MTAPPESLNCVEPVPEVTSHPQSADTTLTTQGLLKWMNHQRMSMIVHLCHNAISLGQASAQLRIVVNMQAYDITVILPD